MREVVKMERVVDEQGRLLDRFKPAAYLDSSVLIEYWCTYGIDLTSNGPIDQILRPMFWQLVSEVSGADKNLQLLCDIRRQVENRQSRLSLITSPIALLELIEWFTYSGIKDIFASSMGIKRVERKLNKEKIRKILSTIEEQATADPRSLEEPGMPSEAMNLLTLTFINPTVARSQELYGVIIADIQNFAFPEDWAWEAAGELARFQVGAADVLHVLVAYHLGCQYFASFDSDFRSSAVRECLQRRFQLELLSSCQELFNAIANQ